MLKRIIPLLATLFALLLSNSALASHFRYGTINWRVPDPIAFPLTVEFTVQTAWRFDFVDCTSLDFGDGSPLNPCTTGNQIGAGVDTAGQQYFVQEYKVTHTYPMPGTYTAFFESCCRIAGLQNGAGANFRVEATIALGSGNTGGPTTISAPIVQLQVGGVRTYPLPVFDPDGDPLTCRFGTPAETGLPAGQEIPLVNGNGAAPTLSLACLLTWDVTQAMVGQKYVIHVIMESTHNGITSATAVDFIIEMVAGAPPTCAGTTTATVPIGQMYTTMVTGNVVPSGSLQVTTQNAPMGATLTPPSGTTQNSPFTTTFSWTPTAADVGTNIVIVNFKTPQNVGGLCTLTIFVPACATFGQPCVAPAPGECANGVVVCSGINNPVCQAGNPAAEACDNLDNDCDGAVDNGNPGGGAPCSSGEPGVCDAGTTACTGGSLVCLPDIIPGTEPELCNSLDDNCDGVVDEGNPEGGAACSTGLFGVCNAGVETCMGSSPLPCVPTIQPNTLPELCNSLDDDCDNAVDEGFNIGAPCTSGIGACQQPGAFICTGPNNSGCDAVPLEPNAEICGNAIDEDCNGALDNGCPDTDMDGIIDAIETQIGTNPNDADSDDDGVLDGQEPQPGVDTDGDGLINALDPDSDNDGLFDGTEMGLDCSNPATDMSAGACTPDGDNGATKTDPLDWDTDGGGVSDGSEDSDLDGVVDANETDPTEGNAGDDAGVVDSDGDGLSDDLEATLGSDPNDADTDDDGTLDGMEANPSHDTDGDGLINVLDVDSDNDGLFDGTEQGFDCSDPSTDAAAGHCIADGDSGATRTSPVDADSDNGGVNDGSEDTNLNGVVDPGELDPTAGHGADDAGVVDSDGDGLSDGFEMTIGTDPNDADSDDDGVLDGNEANPSDDADGDGNSNANDPDADGDGLFDGTELGLDCSNPATDVTQNTCTPDGDSGATTTNPLDPDTDNGGVPDGEEDADHNGVVGPTERDPNDAVDDSWVDTDGDGLFDPIEVSLGTDPLDADTDDDGVIDGQEPDLLGDADGDGLNGALDPDSDNDGLLDGTELGLDCSNPDTNQGVCIPDGDSGATTTDPLDADTDDGSVMDGSEDINHNGVLDPGETDPTAGHGADDTAIIDSDMDGLSDQTEIAIGTDPMDADSDDDGVPDGQEINPGVDSDGDGLINGLDPDSDNDGLFDGTELGFDCSNPATDANAGNCIPDADPFTTTDPLDADTDDGGVIDGAEDFNHNGQLDAGETDPTAGHGADDTTNPDSDMDGLPDAYETQIGSDPNDADSDDDGVPDGQEPNPANDTDGDGIINILDPDSDDDGLFDGTELGFDCSNPATDVNAGNCIPDGDGGATTTSPLDPDTDNGGVSDGDEDANHNGVVDQGERDPLDPSDDMPVNPPECEDDSDCGGPKSGQVCNASGSCEDGCRGTDGNGCPTGQECSSTDDTIGTCEWPQEEEDAYYGEGNGLVCAARPGNDNGSSGTAWFVGLIAGMGLIVRRRRNSRR